MKRRIFIQKSLIAGIGAATAGEFALAQQIQDLNPMNLNSTPFFKLSLAQWSLHRAIKSNALDAYDFAKKAKSMGFEGIEYVNQLYPDVMKSKNKGMALKTFIAKCNAEAKKHAIENLLIMIDGEGDLAVSSATERNRAIENHKIWVETAAAMGCHSIRINLFGESEPMQWKNYAADSMSRLGEFSENYKVNIIVENHGYLSSNAALVMEMLAQVNRTNCGTLPDFGNFCLERKDNERWDASCIREYDRYQGVEEMMPRAFAVSAKSHDFDDQGNEIHTDYERMLRLVKDSGYNGYIGIEYEGSELSETEGILATKELLINKAKSIS